ncbi:MAG: hypothetical protein WC208_09765 [Gallionella sp.]|jgi:hypothetical protein
MRALIHRRVLRICKTLAQRRDFVLNVDYYWRCQHHRFRRAIEMARNTIYH